MLVQVGQCGNQLGEALLHELRADPLAAHYFAPDGTARALALDAERKYEAARDKRKELEAVVQALSEQLQVSIRDRARLQGKLDRMTRRVASPPVPRLNAGKAD